MSRDLYPVTTPPVTAFFDHLRALENDADYPFSSIISSSSSSASSPLSETFLSKSSQPFVRPKQRLILFNWMAIVCQDNLLKRQTYHSAVSMVDRYTRKRHNLRLTEFQCLGAACVSLSSKLEEIHPPSLEDLSEATGGYVAKQDISNMEFDVCSILGWRLLSPTVVSWIGALCHCVGSAADAATDLLAMRSSQETHVNALDASSLSSSSIFSSSRANSSQQGSSKEKVSPSSSSSSSTTTTAKATKTAIHAESEATSNQKKRKREGSIGHPRQSLSKTAAASSSCSHSSDKKIQSLLPFKKVTKDAQVVSQKPIDTFKKDSSSPLTLPPPLTLIEHSLPISKALFAALLGCSGKLTENGDPHVIRDIPQIVALYSDDESCTTNGLSPRTMLSLRLPLVSSKRGFPEEYLCPVAPSSIHRANTERALEYDTNHAEFVFVSSSLDNNSSTSDDAILSSLSESSTLASSQGQGSSQIHSQGSSQSTESATAKPYRRGRSLRKIGGEKSGRVIDCGVIESSQDSSFSSSLPSISSLGEPSSSRLLSTLTSLQNKLPSKLLLDCFTVADACVFHVNVSSFPPSILSAAILMVVLRRYKEEAEVALADERTRGEGEVHALNDNSSSSSSSFLGSRDSDVLMRLHNLMPLVVEVVRHVIFDTVRCTTTNRSQGDCSIEKASASTADAPSAAHPKGGSPTNSNRVSKCYDEDGKLVETLPSSSSPSSSFASALSKTAPVAPVSIEAPEEARVSSVYIPTTLLSVPILSSRPEKEEGGESREKHLRKDVLSCVSTLEIRWNIFVRAIAWVYSMTEALPTYTPHVDIVSCPNELAQFVEKSEWQLLQTTSASLSSHVAQKLANFDDGSLTSTASASDADLHTATIVFPEIASSWHGSNKLNVEQLVDVVLDTLDKLKKRNVDKF